MKTIYFFKTEIAGVKIEIECFSKHVFYACKDYLADYDDADYTIGVSEEEIRNEIIQTMGETVKAEDYDERIAVEYADCELKIILRKISNVLADLSILIIHGAAIAIHEKCYIFTADSGTGKTTHILNWLKRIPGTIVVNGDKPFVDLEKKKVYGSPWSGKERLNMNTVVPLAGIIALERGANNFIRKVSFTEIMPMLIQQTYIPSKLSPGKGYQLLGMLKDVPCYKLTCNMEEESAAVAYNGLCGKDE